MIVIYNEAEVLEESAELIAMENEENVIGKFLWEIFAYSLKWSTKTPKGE